MLSDWAELGQLWGGCGPVVLHLLAYGLEQLLHTGMGVAASSSWILGRWRRGFSWLLIAGSLVSLSLCSALSLLLALLATLLQVGVAV